MTVALNTVKQKLTNRNNTQASAKGSRGYLYVCIAKDVLIQVPTRFKGETGAV